MPHPDDFIKAALQTGVIPPGGKPIERAETPATDMLVDFIEALQDITEAKGAFKRDPFEHAKSCITDMAQTAIDVLKKHGITPRGNGPQ